MTNNRKFVMLIAAAALFMSSCFSFDRTIDNQALRELALEVAKKDYSVFGLRLEDCYSTRYDDEIDHVKLYLIPRLDADIENSGCKQGATIFVNRRTGDYFSVPMR